MHSPEPWIELKSGGEPDWASRVIRCADDGSVAYIPQGLVGQNAAADAQRIVACVNAMHHIPTGDIERGIFADMKAAVLSRDAEMLNAVAARLIDIMEPRNTNAPV